uniref:Uncharacterized protein n=1 Tax=Romanomermis culicivorax TaxID=13658 RepID=A0A915HXG3_ROMCU
MFTDGNTSLVYQDRRQSKTGAKLRHNRFTKALFRTTSNKVLATSNKVFLIIIYNCLYRSICRISLELAKSKPSLFDFSTQTCLICHKENDRIRSPW